MADLSDTQIRVNLRSILAEAGIDPNRTTFTCTSGTVRLLGDLLGVQPGQPVRPAQVNDVECSIRRTEGVKRVHMHLEGWERSAIGDWVPVASPEPSKLRAVQRREDAE